MEIDKKNDCLWKILQRIDQFTISTNNKATVVLAFNSFIITGLIINWVSVLNNFAGYPLISFIVALILVLIAGSSLYSLFRTFQVLYPFLESHAAQNEYYSNIFFNHIANFKDQDKYFSSIKVLDENIFSKDISIQIFANSSGLTMKFIKLKSAINPIIYLIIPFLSLILLLKLVLLIIQVILK